MSDLLIGFILGILFKGMFDSDVKSYRAGYNPPPGNGDDQ